MIAGSNQWLTFEIPDPISANALNHNVSEAERSWAARRYRKMRGRGLTEAYKTWKDLAGWQVLQQLPKPQPRCVGEVFMDIDMPSALDIDNSLKAIGDLLQLKTGLGIIANDKLIVDWHIRRVAKDEPC